MSRLFIVNPQSARVAKKGSTLETVASETGIPLVRLDSFDLLPNAVTQAAANGVIHVVIEGGDGTVQGVISEFLTQADSFPSFPSFSIVPGGMTNQVAKNIGLKSASPRVVKAALEISERTIVTPLLEVVDSDGPTYAGFLFSTGAIPQITRYTTGELHRKGIGGSLAVLGGILKGMRGDDEALMKVTPVQIAELYDGLHLGTVVTTLPSLILGIDPFWGDGNGPLRTTWVTGSYRRLARNICGIWIGRKQKDRSPDGYYSGRFPALSYQYHGDVVLDGEFLSFPSGKFTVRPTRDVTFLR
ncbi:diacylglycerol kinase [Litorimonas cladophorae]|uniref:Diacylglycerol kinase n=1 Tax=Litorimonas cladophorae TaxID=1220491 RepID=A0A918KE31_9PROT|nr:diacylglycerol kinase family protein [Litorimonas cladophorae]GGX60286.1 diacylglycerol kinase [Litorimonas cladophorae]